MASKKKLQSSFFPNPIAKLTMPKMKAASVGQSLTFRFNPAEEDLEEVNEIGEEVVLKVESDLHPEVLLTAEGDGAVPSTENIPSPAVSPTKTSSWLVRGKGALYSGMNKRSFSLDSTSGNNVSEAGTGNVASSLFSELKGKIARTVEERFHIDLNSNSSGRKSTRTDAVVTRDGLTSETAPTTPTVTDTPGIVKSESDFVVARMSSERIDIPKDDRRRKSAELDQRTDRKTPQPSPSSSMDLKRRRPNSLLGTNDIPSVTMSSLQAESDSSPEHQIQEERILARDTDSPVTSPVQQHGPYAELAVHPKTDPQPLKNSLFDFCKHYLNFRVSLLKLLLVIVVFVTWTYLPITRFWHGLLLGIYLYYLIQQFLKYLTRPTEKIPTDSSNKSDLSTEGTFQFLAAESRSDPLTYKIWMNELLQDYDPAMFHYAGLHSVYVRLEGSWLRLSYPNIRIPRASMYNESKHDPTFIYQRHYHIGGATVKLLPEHLSRKRFWKRRYPICIYLARPMDRDEPSGPPSIDGEDSCSESSPQVPKQAVLGKSPERTQASVETDSSPEELVPGRDAVYEGVLPPDVSPLDPKSEYQPVLDNSSLTPPHLIKWNRGTIYLFPRSGRDKEECFRILCKAAILGTTSDLNSRPETPGSNPQTDPYYLFSMDGSYDTDEWRLKHDRLMLEFCVFMGRLCSQQPQSPTNTSNTSSPGEDTTSYSWDLSPAVDLQWFNVLLGRLFFDFLREKQFATIVQRRVQRKLSALKVPYLISELRCVDLELGSELPHVYRISMPRMDERGLWLELELTYFGGIKFVLETKVNLMKLKEQGTECQRFVSPTDSEAREPKFTSDHEESGESSSDEEELIGVEYSDESFKVSGKRKLLQIVDTITHSSAFRKASEYNYVKRAIEGVSNTPLVLTVDVTKVEGVLLVNIPPPPSDRIWIGFRERPELVLVAKPRVGEKEVNLTHLIDWIQKKITTEFYRKFVMPNMEDFQIPFMSSGMRHTPSVAPNEDQESEKSSVS